MEAGAATNGGSTFVDKDTNSGSRGKEGGPSLNLALARKATPPAYFPSDIKKWHRVVYEGVLPKDKTQGRFKTRVLSPKATYEVAFVVKVNRTGFERHSPVELEQDLQDGTKQTGTVYLRLMPVYEWINLHTGKFMIGPKIVGTIYFAHQGTVNPQKTGLILKGVRIHPRD